LSVQLPEEDAFYDDKSDILEICGMKQPVIFSLVPEQDPPELLMVFLRLLNVSGIDAFHLEALFRSEIEDHLLYPLSEENESDACDTMINGCQDALKAYYSVDYASGSSPSEALIKQVDSYFKMPSVPICRARSAMENRRRWNGY